jgi:hypothetical protein
MSKFPKTIYVQTEKETNEDEFLLAWDNPEDANDGKVAVYELRGVKSKATKTILS